MRRSILTGVVLALALHLIVGAAIAQQAQREFRYVYNIATGEFLYGGTWPGYDPTSGLSPGQAVAVMMDRAPILRTERYDGASPIKRRSATTQEVTAWDAANEAKQAVAEVKRRELVALALYEHKRRTGDWPSGADAVGIMADLRAAWVRAGSLSR